MNKLKTITVFAFLLMGAGFASAQTVSGNGPGKGQTLSAEDQAKFDALNAQQSAEAQKQATLDAANAALMQQKMEEEGIRQGYMPIPGFTYTGDPLVDKPAYNEAKAALNQSNVTDD